jgi:hypothetical protein
MITLLISHLKLLLPLAVLILIAIKTIHFLHYKRKSWGPRRFFYFTYQEIEWSQDEDRETSKRIQNRLSISILIVLLLYVFFLAKALIQSAFTFN